MDTLIFLLVHTVNSVINVLLIAMLLRVILHLFDPMEGGKLYTFFVVITEPVIFPLRMLFAKKHWFEGSPLDMPFLFTSILLSLIRTALFSVG